MMLRRALLLTLVALLLGVSALAQKDKSTYTDTKKRFALKLPLGWRLHPTPGDTRGMMFRKDADGAFALLHVGVRELRPRESLEDSLAEATLPLAAEIGFEKGSDVPTSVGLHAGKRRSITVFASGDRRTVRAVDLFVLHAFGHVHTLHFETLDKERGRFARDQDRLVASYEPKAGLALYGPLVGQWHNDEGSPPLSLSEDNRFVLGPLRGTFDADGGQLQLHVAQGTERYRYRLERNKLLLSSSNLEGVAEYARTASPRFGQRPERQAKAKPLLREELIGRWRVLDMPATEPLTLQLAPSGSVAFGPLSGRWQYRSGLLTITSTGGETVTYHVSLESGRLLLGGGDLERELRMVRE
jgi:hypothetical protein